MQLPEAPTNINIEKDKGTEPGYTECNIYEGGHTSAYEGARCIHPKLFFKTRWDWEL